MSENKTIFHIDDDMEVHLLVKTMLHRTGYHLEFALTGWDALKQLTAFSPDLILLDLAMPIMDAWDFREKMKKLPHLKNVPVVVVTGKLGSTDISKDLDDLEANDCIQKPFNGKEFMEKIRHYLS